MFVIVDYIFGKGPGILFLWKHSFVNGPGFVLTGSKSGVSWGTEYRKNLGSDDSDQDSMWLASVLLVVCGAGFVALLFEGWWFREGGVGCWRRGCGGCRGRGRWGWRRGAPGGRSRSRGLFRSRGLGEWWRR